MDAFSNTDWFIIALTALPVTAYFLLFSAASLLWITIPEKESRKVTAEDSTIVAAARNEEEIVESFLEGIRPVLIQSGTSMVIADDFSTDRSVELIRKFEEENDNILLVRNSGKGGKQSALESAIKHVKTEKILFTDVDCFPVGSWPGCMSDSLDEATYVTGPVKLRGEGFLAAFQKVEQLGLNAVSHLFFALNRPVLSSGANSGIKAGFFRKLNGYEGALSASGDDILLLSKVFRSGEKSTFVKSKHAIVETKAARGLKEFFSQRIRWASKNGKYKDKISLLIGSAVFFTACSMLLTIVLTFFSGKFIPFLYFIWGIKLLGDSILFFALAPFFRQTNLFWMVFAGQPFFIFYSLLITIPAMRGKFIWKGRIAE